VRVDTQLRLFEAARTALPQDPFPHYLGHLRVASRGAVSDVLLTAGRRPRSPSQMQRDKSRELMIADYQGSGFARLFFSFREGQRYRNQSVPGHESGSVLERNVVGFHERQLVDVVVGDRLLSRRGTGRWQRFELCQHILEARSPTQKRQLPSLIDVHLDPAQQSVVDLPRGRAVLVLGEAGHGKTTVALHRLAQLKRRAPGPFRVAVIVPGVGLRRVIEPLMHDLGLAVEVRAYERWALRQARRAFSDLPRRTSQDATASVIRIKRDPALRVALAVLSRRPPARIDDDGDAREPGEHVSVSRGDLQHLFGDRKLVDKVIAASSDPVGGHGVAELLEHTRIQFSRSTEQEYAHVDRQRLVTLDGRRLDAGTPLEDAGSIDSEDSAVLFELDRLRAERLKRTPTCPRAYDCIMIDEAQELAPLELCLVGRSLAVGGSLIVAGDADQQTDPAAFFGGWEQSMAELGCCDYERVVLGVNYRCPPAVVQVARQLSAARASVRCPPTPARATGAPGPSRFLSFINECHLGVTLIDELQKLEHSDRRASVAVICRSTSTARRLTRLLRHGVDARLVLDGAFVYRSGINVTTVDQVKGLEFDYVIVPDASRIHYPNDATSRRALYVAVTRARHQLLLGAVASRTELLDK
jgi:DNA helicase-2/ATP-dependent DNA helicase PcrA